MTEIFDHFALTRVFVVDSLGHKFITPKSLKDRGIVEDYYQKYMYIDAVHNIYMVCR
jgi:hypothetical protein